MERTANGYRLSTGRSLDAHLGILGVTPGDPRLFSGYDMVITESDTDIYRLPEETLLTDAERQEIAAFMIEQWRTWKASRA